MGYIVVQDTASSAVKALAPSSPGVVHGAVYKNVFAEDVGNTIGEAFAIMGGEFKWALSINPTRVIVLTMMEW